MTIFCGLPPQERTPSPDNDSKEGSPTMPRKKADFDAPCQACGGRCCKYLAIGVDAPTSRLAIENIRWYLYHENVSVFADHDKQWYVEFRTPCRAQDKHQRCTVYEKRPDVCRNYGTAEGDCEYYDIPFAHRFDSAPEFEAWLDEKGRKWRH